MVLEQTNRPAAGERNNSLIHTPSFRKGGNMNNRWGILMAAFAVLVVLTGMPVRHAQPLTKLSDHQMSKVVGGEKEKSCTELYNDNLRNCSFSLEFLNTFCRFYYGTQWAWCEIKAAANWIGSLF